MGRKDALALIQSLAASGAFDYRWHARKRARQRGVGDAEIANALQYATKAELQANGRYRVEGLGLDDDVVLMIVILEDDFLWVHSLLC